MVPTVVIVVTLVAVLPTAAVVTNRNATPRLPADDAAKIQGNWACAAAVVDGKPLADTTVSRLRLVMTADRYRTERGDEVLFDSTYRLDPGANPKRIEMIGTEGDAEGKPALGIYSLEGDTLKICYTMPGAQRPTAFESKPGSRAFLVTWSRARKQP